MHAEHKVPLTAEQAQDGAGGPELAAHAAAIRTLGRRFIADVIEIGARLRACRTILKDDRGWRAWLEQELRLSPQSAGRYIQVHDLAQQRSNLERSALSVSAIYLLAAPSTPPDARDAVIARAEAGEVPPVAEVKRVVQNARGRRQPAKKTTTKPTPSPSAVAESAPKNSKARDDIESKNEELQSQFEQLQKEARSLLLQLAAAKFEIEKLKTEHRFHDVTGEPFLATIVELDMPVVWTPEEIIADIDHPNLTPEHLRRAAELLHAIADALVHRKPVSGALPPPNVDGLDIPDFLDRTKGPDATASLAPPAGGARLA